MTQVFPSLGTYSQHTLFWLLTGQGLELAKEKSETTLSHLINLLPGMLGPYPTGQMVVTHHMEGCCDRVLTLPGLKRDLTPETQRTRGYGF